MKFPSANRVAVGVVLAGAAGMGVGAAVAAHVATPAGSTPRTSSAVDAALRTPAPSLVHAHPQRVAAQRPAAAPVPAPRPVPRAVAPAAGVTMADAMRIAARTAGGRVTESDEEREVTGLVFEFDVERADGTTRKVVIDSRRGQVLSNRLKD